MDLVSCGEGPGRRAVKIHLMALDPGPLGLALAPSTPCLGSVEILVPGLPLEWSSSALSAGEALPPVGLMSTGSVASPH